MRAMATIAISPIGLSACQTIGGYAAYDVSTGKYYAAAEPATAQFGMWCPNTDGYGFDTGEPVKDRPKRKNLRRVDVSFDGPHRKGSVTDEVIKWREYRRGTFFECPELGKEIQ